MPDMQEPDSEDIKEVYARFGLAYYHAECLHRGLCNLYSLTQLPPNGPVTAPRLEEHLRDAFNSTLGQIVRFLEPQFPPALWPKLEQAISH